MAADTALIENLYRQMLRVRLVEERIADAYPTDKIKSPVHLSIGQEAVSVGVCAALDPADAVYGTYRGHALYLAKGGNLNAMIAELYGKATGCARGKGGSMHLVDPDASVMASSAIVASTIPLAVGHAYAMKVQKSGRVVVSFFGDGAVEEGMYHEAVSFASLRKLPIVFVCENNGYAIHTPLKERQPNQDIAGRARSYGLTAVTIEGNDVLEIHRQAERAVRSVRPADESPWLIECMTYRWREHVGPGTDFHLGYRDKSEAQPWIDNDQVLRLGNDLSQQRRDSIREDVGKEIEAAFDFAEISPFPDAAELYEDVYEGS